MATSAIFLGAMASWACFVIVHGAVQVMLARSLRHESMKWSLGTPASFGVVLTSDDRVAPSVNWTDPWNFDNLFPIWVVAAAALVSGGVLAAVLLRCGPELGRAWRLTGRAAAAGVLASTIAAPAIWWGTVSRVYHDYGWIEFAPSSPVAHALWLAAYVSGFAFLVARLWLKLSRKGRCNVCGYDLSGARNAPCPECGPKRRRSGWRRGAYVAAALAALIAAGIVIRSIPTHGPPTRMTNAVRWAQMLPQLYQTWDAYLIFSEDEIIGFSTEGGSGAVVVGRCRTGSASGAGAPDGTELMMTAAAVFETGSLGFTGDRAVGRPVLHTFPFPGDGPRRWPAIQIGDVVFQRTNLGEERRPGGWRVILMTTSRVTKCWPIAPDSPLGVQLRTAALEAACAKTSE